MDKKIQIRCKYKRLVKIDDLKPHPKNPNIHSTDQIKRLAKLFKGHGMRLPIIVSNLSGCVVAGHGRIEAAKELGMEKVPVDFQEFETEEAEYAFLVSDNAIAEWSSLNVAMINKDAMDLGPDFDIEMLGMKDFEIEPADKLGGVDEDDAPPTPKQAKSKPGDVYQLGEHRLICGDSTMIDTVEKVMANQKADLVFTDPPYGIDYEGGSKKREKIKNDAINIFEFYRDFLVVAKTVAKPGASIYVWHASSQTHNCILAAIEAGWLYKQYIVWRKNNATFGRQDYHWQHEPCLYGWGADGSHSWHGDRKQTTVWDIERPSKSDLHPTMKPVELCEIAIKNSSKAGDIVYEPFGGSGSTLIACEKVNRICYSVELDPKYVDVIVSRYVQYTENTTIIRNGKEIKWA